MPNAQMTLANVDLTIVLLQRTTLSLRELAGIALNGGGRQFKSEVRKRMSLTDHKPRDFARLDHPYARRHGTIQIHRRKPWQIHKQSGRMVDALSGKPITVNGAPGYEVTFNFNRVPYARWVIQGTKVMLGRDIFGKALLDPDIQMAIRRRIVREMQKNRAKVGLRFG